MKSCCGNPSKKASCLDIPESTDEIEVWFLPWTEHDRDSGPDDGGYSLHLSTEDMDKFIKSHWEGDRRINKELGIVGTPDYYVSPEKHLAKTVFLSGPKITELRRAKLMGEFGKRYYGKLETKIIAK